MKTYINNYGLLSFSVEGNDYISNKGDEIEVPENDHVKNLVAKGYLIEKVVKPSKLQK